MHTLRSVLAALILVALSALPVAADHGYWPESGVEPAVVAGHESRTQANTEAAAWGSACTTLGQSGREATLDVYGHVLETDYAVAVVLAHRDGLPLDGPNAVTIFRSPKAGQFVWADSTGTASSRATTKRTPVS